MFKKQYIPNILTGLRLSAVPFFVGAYFLLPSVTGAYVALAIFLLASVTDWFDGYLARKWQAESAWGKCFDPIADKALIITALFMVVWQEGQVVLPAIVITLREVIVSGLRIYVAAAHGQLNVSHLAKVKTICQMVAISVFIIIPALPLDMALWLLDGPAILLMWVAAILTGISGLGYLRKSLSYLKKP